MCVFVHQLQYPWDVIKKAWGLGLMTAVIPQEYGECVCVCVCVCGWVYGWVGDIIVYTLYTLYRRAWSGYTG